MPVSHRDIAADLRRQIREGLYGPGDKLPMLTELQERYQVGYQTVRSAISLLETEGLVMAVRRRGTVVRDRPERTVAASTQVDRDESGYTFDPAGQRWIDAAEPTVRWAPAPAELRSIIGAERGAEVLVRERLVRPAQAENLRQLVTSYIPDDVARSGRLDEPGLNPGDIYDRLESMGHGPLQWTSSVSAVMPSPDEAALLGLPTDVGVPLLRVVRVAKAPSGQVVEVNDATMSAELFEVRFEIRRSPSARQPEADDGSG